VTAEKVWKTWDGQRNRLRDIRLMKLIMFHKMTPQQNLQTAMYNCIKPWLFLNKNQDKIMSDLEEIVESRNKKTLLH